MHTQSMGCRSLTVIMAVVLLVACGGGTREDGSGAPAAGGSADRATADDASAAQAPDACSLLDRERMARTIGRELREGVPEDAPPGFSSCSFSVVSQMSAPPVRPDAGLPASLSFDSVTIATFPATPERFAEQRRMLGAAGEDVPGIGDDAHFYGPNLIYVLVRNIGFSIRMYADPQTDEHEARARAVMLVLAEQGASRLR